jgi:hypothetical protein
MYETLLDRAEHIRILEFLGVRDVDQQLRAASIKQNPTDLRDSISNFSELAARLQDRDLKDKLHDCGI